MHLLASFSNAFLFSNLAFPSPPFSAKMPLLTNCKPVYVSCGQPGISQTVRNLRRLLSVSPVSWRAWAHLCTWILRKERNLHTLQPIDIAAHTPSLPQRAFTDLHDSCGSHFQVGKSRINQFRKKHIPEPGNVSVRLLKQTRSSAPPIYITLKNMSMHHMKGNTSGPHDYVLFILVGSLSRILF